jgi:formylglycine-generating enzyme required for sulfatase activity
MRGTRRIASSAVALGLCACSLITKLDGLSGGVEQSPAEGGIADATADVSTIDAPLNDAGAIDAEAGCKGDHGPKAVRIGTYCIDATEVTGRDYTEFLAAKAGDTSGQVAECAWNTSYEPSISKTGEVPVIGADWCDALAYCAWAGKRLCGKIGGGPLPASLVSNPFADEWFRACTHEGTRAYPYGTTRDANACNGSDRDGGGGPVAVATLPGCEGGYPGLFDLAGNLWEWVDRCGDGGADAGCLLRGSSYAAANNTSCTDVNTPRRDRGGQNDTTIRCCSDVQ